MAKDVTILTGFLGAGKTTLLNEIISKKKDIRFAIVENEIGAESIDADLIIKGDDQIIELNNGCLCCSLNDDLFEILNNLWDKKASWDHLIIEATGIADPAGIAHPFLTMNEVKKGFNLKRIICVVDAELIEDQLRETKEAINQIAFSDLILLNKVEKVNEHYILELQETLKAINPFADVLVVYLDDFKIEQLFERERGTDFPGGSKSFLTSKGMFNLSSNTGQPLVAIGNTHKKHQHSDIETILLRYNKSMDIPAMEHRIMVFLILQSANVYRIKGIIYSDAYERKVILQTVGKSVAVTLGDVWLPDEAKETKIVIIGKQLQVAGFDKMFRTCIANRVGM